MERLKRAHEEYLKGKHAEFEQIKNQTEEMGKSKLFEVEGEKKSIE